MYVFGFRLEKMAALAYSFLRLVGGISAMVSFSPFPEATDWVIVYALYRCVPGGF